MLCYSSVACHCSTLSVSESQSYSETSEICAWEFWIFSGLQVTKSVIGDSGNRTGVCETFCSSNSGTTSWTSICAASTFGTNCVHFFFCAGGGLARRPRMKNWTVLVCFYACAGNWSRCRSHCRGEAL